MTKTKADILYESLANFADEEGAIECGAKMRDFARELERENARLRECNRACAEWVKQSANQWMHRPRGGWPIKLRKAYEAVHDAALPNV